MVRGSSLATSSPQGALYSEWSLPLQKKKNQFKKKWRETQEVGKANPENETTGWWKYLGWNLPRLKDKEPTMRAPSFVTLASF